MLPWKRGESFLLSSLILAGLFNVKRFGRKNNSFQFALLLRYFGVVSLGS